MPRSPQKYNGELAEKMGSRIQRLHELYDRLEGLRSSCDLSSVFSSGNGDLHDFGSKLERFYVGAGILLDKVKGYEHAYRTVNGCGNQEEVQALFNSFYSEYSLFVNCLEPLRSRVQEVLSSQRQQEEVNTKMPGRRGFNRPNRMRDLYPRVLGLRRAY